jgi:outer membrane protein TolC
LCCFQSAYSAELNLLKHLKLSFQNDPDFQQIIQDKQRLKFIVDQGLPSRQVTLSVSNENGYSSESDQNTTLTTGELSKEIIESGTELSLSHTKTTRPDRKENVTQIRLEQSLYKNMLGRDVRLKKESLEEQKKLNSLELQELQEQYLSKILKKYLELSKSYRDYILAKNIHEEAKRLKSNVESKLNSKIASVTDLNRAKLLILLREEEFLEKQNIFESLKSQIIKTISFEFDQFVESDSDKLINILQKLETKLSNPQWESTRSSKIATYKEDFLRKEAVLKDRFNSPELNLVVGYNKDDSSRFSTVIKRNEAVVGLRLEVPFGDTRSSADSQLANIDLLKSQTEYKKDALEYQRQKTIMLNKLKQVKEQLQIDSKKVKLTKMILKDEQKRFSIGRIELETLIQLKTDFASYRVKEEQSKLGHAVVLIDWLNLNDALESSEIFNRL